jgi:hypothetical protein
MGIKGLDAMGGTPDAYSPKQHAQRKLDKHKKLLSETKLAFDGMGRKSPTKETMQIVVSMMEAEVEVFQAILDAMD